jgi:hypothetical protein
VAIADAVVDAADDRCRLAERLRVLFRRDGEQRLCRGVPRRLRVERR